MWLTAHAQSYMHIHTNSTTYLQCLMLFGYKGAFLPTVTSGQSVTFCKYAFRPQMADETLPLIYVLSNLAPNSSRDWHTKRGEAKCFLHISQIQEISRTVGEWVCLARGQMDIRQWEIRRGRTTYCKSKAKTRPWKGSRGENGSKMLVKKERIPQEQKAPLGMWKMWENWNHIVSLLAAVSHKWSFWRAGNWGQRVTLISCGPAVHHSMVVPRTVPPKRQTENSGQAPTIESFSSRRCFTLRTQTESRHCVVSKISQSPTSSYSSFPDIFTSCWSPPLPLPSHISSSLSSDDFSIHPNGCDKPFTFSVHLSRQNGPL